MSVDGCGISLLPTSHRLRNFCPDSTCLFGPAPDSSRADSSRTGADHHPRPCSLPQLPGRHTQMTSECLDRLGEDPFSKTPLERDLTTGSWTSGPRTLR